MLDRPRGNIKLDVLDRCIENIVDFGWSVDLHIDMKNLIVQEERIRTSPIPVIIDHIARVKPAEGLQQAGFQLLLELMQLKHVWTKVSGADKICETMVHSYYGLPFVEVIPYAQAVISRPRPTASSGAPTGRTRIISRRGIRPTTATWWTCSPLSPPTRRFARRFWSTIRRGSTALFKGQSL